jgi:hypothetical protein
MAYSCQPFWLSTQSPTAKSGWCEISTRLTVDPTMTSPIATGGAYDGASLILPRM